VRSARRNDQQKNGILLPGKGIGIIDIALTALVLGSGVMDIASFLTLGNVFTSAMTGNTALLGIALGQGNVLSATHSLVALVGFIAGAAAAAVIYLRRQSQPSRSLEVIRPLLWIEISCLTGFAAILSLMGPPGKTIALYALILLSAIGMGIQGVAARHINATGINTIVFTSTIINIVIDLTGTFIKRSADSKLHSDTKRQIGMFLAYGIGALLAGILAGRALPILAWIPMLAVVAALVCCQVAARAERARGEELPASRTT
jgi:uncharacterized membrane protein YoaK (UPF0700 family)